ncbi:MAG: LLM class flavin-dependent oxidoreductase [Acidimicrobiaceae bacterium]|nr:LLM class flavin-dependent oxidoreductase [Acidimicrobiaceae bacterium]MCY3947586.1 LLM class flavin-dependent oxidoreductase [Acidimicrobiaceae bacterium]
MAQSLRFGIVHDFRCPPGSDVTMPQVYAETFEQVVLAEHHFIEDGYLPNFVPVAGAAAALTSTMRFSTDICLMPFRDQVRLAEDLAVLDNISDGRMELGIGMGYAAHEFAGFGLPLSRRVSLTEEAIDVLRLAWSGKPFSYEGKRYSYRDLRVTPDPVQPGGPPLWVAATSEAGALRAARFDTNLLPQGPKAAVLDPWKEALAADGRGPGDKRVGIIRGVYVTDGRDPADDPTWEAIAAAEKYRRDVYIGIIKASADHKATARERAARTGPRQPDPLNPLVWTVGDADHCVAELTTMIRDHDVTDLVTWGGPPGLPPSVMNASLERMARDVIPRVRADLA